jgi:DNA-binding transcriptional regulator GbsR (MarR family)
MEEVRDAVGLMKSFLIEKNLDEWWVNEMQEQIKEVRSLQKQVKSALRESREDSEVVSLQKDIMKSIKMLEYSLGKSHYIDAQLDQTAEVLSSLIEKRL